MIFGHTENPTTCSFAYSCRDGNSYASKLSACTSHGASSSIVFGFSRRTGIDGASDDSAERVPCAVVEPVVKLVKAFLGQETSGAVIEIPVYRSKEGHDHVSVCVCGGG